MAQSAFLRSIFNDNSWITKNPILWRKKRKEVISFNIHSTLLRTKRASKPFIFLEKRTIRVSQYHQIMWNRNLAWFANIVHSIIYMRVSVYPKWKMWIAGAIYLAWIIDSLNVLTGIISAIKEYIICFVYNQIAFPFINMIILQSTYLYHWQTWIYSDSKKGMICNYCLLFCPHRKLKNKNVISYLRCYY